MFVGGHTRKIMGVTETPLRMASASPHKFIGGFTVPDPHLEEIAHILGGIEKEMRIANQLKFIELDSADTQLGPVEGRRYRQLRKIMFAESIEYIKANVVIGED